MADTGRSLQMHADRVSFEEADIQIALKPVRLLQHRMTAESPKAPMLRPEPMSALLMLGREFRQNSRAS